MSEPSKLAGAAAAIADALRPLEPAERGTVIEMAKMMCPETATAPARKPRSDRGVSRKGEAAKLPGTES